MLINYNRLAHVVPRSDGGDWRRLALHAACWFVCCILIGCGPQQPDPAAPISPGSDRVSDSQPPPSANRSATEIGMIEQAETLFAKEDFAAVRQLAERRLLEDPQSIAAYILLIQTEIRSDNAAEAISIWNEIRTKSDAGTSSAFSGSHNNAWSKIVSVSVQAGQLGLAEQILTQMIGTSPASSQRRLARWQIRNAMGLRQAASDGATMLCRQGADTPAVIQSLVDRSAHFPHATDLSEARKRFTPGMALALWHFDQQDFQAAIDELNAGTRSKLQLEESWKGAAEALRGRCLANLQRFDLLGDWIAACPESSQTENHYWAAVGIWFTQRREDEQAVASFLRAVSLDPTDSLSYQRLGQSLDRLGKKKLAAASRDRAIDLDQRRLFITEIRRNEKEIANFRSLADLSAKLGRPFEALGWMKLVFADQPAVLRNIEQRRAGLLRDTSLDRVLQVETRLGIPSDQFLSHEELTKAIQALAATKGPTETEIRAAEALATPRLDNVAEARRLGFQWRFNHFTADDQASGSDSRNDLSNIALYQSIGGGIGVVDFDLDGWPDVYLMQGGDIRDSKSITAEGEIKGAVCFRNLNGDFQDVTGDSGLTDLSFGSGVAAGDVNQDGFPDLYLGHLGADRLLINNGDGTFSDHSKRLGNTPDSITSSVAIADLDGDDLPEIFVGNYVEWEGAFAEAELDPEGHSVPTSPLSHYAQPDCWYKQDEQGTFQFQSIDPAVNPPGTSLGIIITDFKGEGRNQTFVGNDGRPNHLLSLEKNEVVNLAIASGVAYSFDGVSNACMGIAAGDFDHNGEIDLHIANFSNEPANFFLQDSAHQFADLANRYGIAEPTKPWVGFGCKGVDLDNNGWTDFVIANGHISDRKHLDEPFEMLPQLLMRSGDQYQAIKPESDSTENYFDHPTLGRTIARLDFNRDHQPDFLIGHLDAPYALLENRTRLESQPEMELGNWIEFELVGSQTERDAIGAQVTVTIADSTGNEIQRREWVTAGDGYFCTDEPVLHLGLGKNTVVKTVQAKWPSGKRQQFKQVKPNNRYLIVENEDNLFKRD